MMEQDYLGKAAEAKHNATAAVKAKKYDEAWGYYHEQKQNYLKHAAAWNFTKAQTLALDGTVSESLANILRLEGKHHDALTHIIYWTATTTKPIKRQKEKLQAYFKRCKFEDIKVSDLNRFIREVKSNPDFVSIRDKVAEWSGRS